MDPIKRRRLERELSRWAIIVLILINVIGEIWWRFLR